MAVRINNSDYDKVRGKFIKILESAVPDIKWEDIDVSAGYLENKSGYKSVLNIDILRKLPAPYNNDIRMREVFSWPLENTQLTIGETETGKGIRLIAGSLDALKEFEIMNTEQMSLRFKNYDKKAHIDTSKLIAVYDKWIQDVDHNRVAETKIENISKTSGSKPFKEFLEEANTKEKLAMTLSRMAGYLNYSDNNLGTVPKMEANSILLLMCEIVEKANEQLGKGNELSKPSFSSHVDMTNKFRIK